MVHRIFLFTLIGLLSPSTLLAQEDVESQRKLVSDTFAGMKLRAIGPALMSGRISDLAVHPDDHDTWYAAVASGGVWKTSNAGNTWEPIFDDQGSYSIGCVTIDPNRPLTVWVGTGENNSQRSVGYGDGVYKSIDGGKNWEKMGLGESEHIGKIIVDPRDSQTIYVAAQGPLWRSGGDRGLYKTTDGGKTWEKILEISEHTGVNEVHFDPRNPDILLASSYQRRRHVWTLINGGPESAIYRSIDAGESWAKMENGLPKVDMGKIGLTVSPADPDRVYAVIEAQHDEGGFFLSRDGGVNWEKQDDYVSASPQYYNELIADPRLPDRVYSMDTFLHRTDDGGKSWYRYPEKMKHVDNHALWIDPEDNEHLLAGCDGGVYESWDLGEHWDFKANLPITQFYKVTPDNDLPFYNVYGGTQDNATQGGPSRTLSKRGIVNSDWFVTVFGDGYKTQIDPENPDIVYSQWQYGGLVRYDRRTGETIFIQPQAEPGEEPLRWNWDSPLLISPHSNTRLYFGAQRLFRSEDRGDSWTAVSPDLTRDLDRNELEVMGRVWSVDAVAKNASTSFYGNIVGVDESPLVEGLLYVGTDDGLLQVSEDGGESWREIAEFSGVPERSYVDSVDASAHDEDTVYVGLNNHKMGDFSPYLLKSSDRGRTWESISSDLPSRGSVYSFAEDPGDPNLLFVGTEFGLFFSSNGGENWIELEGSLPTIAVRDLEIQEREHDLVVGTFGRGIYILDDYRALRQISEAALQRDQIFPVRRAWMYMERDDMGIQFQGHSFYTAPNPPFGALFTYYLSEDLQTRQEKRREEEEAREKSGETISYPDWEELRREDREEEPAVILTVRDAEDQVVRRIEGPVEAGFHRVAWNLRYPAANPVQLEPPEYAPWASPPEGPLSMPGRYSVEMAKRVGGVETPFGDRQEFVAETVGLATLPAPDKVELLAFQRKVAELQRAVLGSEKLVEQGLDQVKHLKRALDQTPVSEEELGNRIRDIEERLLDVQVEISGDATIRKRNEPTPSSIKERVHYIVGAQWESSSVPTETSRAAYRYAAELFAPVLAEVRRIYEELEALNQAMEERGAPWTPGRIPDWQPE